MAVKLFFKHNFKLQLTCC